MLHKILVWIFIVIFSISEAIAGPVLKPSKYLLQWTDSSIILDCHVSKYDNFTTIRFKIDGKEIYNSKTKKSGIIFYLTKILNIFYPIFYQ